MELSISCIGFFYGILDLYCPVFRLSAFKGHAVELSNLPAKLTLFALNFAGLVGFHAAGDGRISEIRPIKYDTNIWSNSCN